MREAYRRRGWAFKNADTIEQCKREGFTQKMQEQKNEGCQVYGILEVNKVPAQLLSSLVWSPSVLILKHPHQIIRSPVSVQRRLFFDLLDLSSLS